MMESEFWHERWREDRIGFHQPDINPHLRTYWPRVAAPPGAPVFVPLCGKSLDMLWLREQGHAVLGVELSPIAVEAFFTENGLDYEQHSENVFTRYEAENIRLLCGDFFDLQPQQSSDVRAVYDRASLIALPPAMRVRYVEHLQRLLPPVQIPMLLVTIDYDQAQMQGPPFAVSDQEVRSLFSPNWSLECILEDDVLAKEPRFRERGLSRMREHIYLLRSIA